MTFRRFPAVILALTCWGFVAPSAQAGYGAAALERACLRAEPLSESALIALVKHKRALVGCSKDVRAASILSFNEPTGATWSHATAAGRFAAFAIESAGQGPIVYGVKVVDVIGGKFCYEAVGSGVSPADSANPASGEPTTALGLSRRGGLGFIAGPGRGPVDTGVFPNLAPWTGYEVIVRDADGVRQVGAGPDIARDSLRVGIRAATWAAGGVTWTAPLSRKRVRCAREL